MVLACVMTGERTVRLVGTTFSDRSAERRPGRRFDR
jgi:hypothetical protein